MISELQFERDRRRFNGNVALLRKMDELQKRKERKSPREELAELYTRKNTLTSQLDKINLRIYYLETTTPWELRRP